MQRLILSGYRLTQSMSDHPSASNFPTTHWSLIQRIRGADPAEAQNAMREVFTAYRYPLYSYLRATGLHHEDAEDVLQGFFEKMLRTEGLSTVDPERGRLRGFLLGTLSRFKLNFIRGESRRRARVKAESELWDSDEARYQTERLTAEETPEDFYDRQWARELIARVRAELREDYVRRGRLLLHDALLPLITGATGKARNLQSAVAATLGMDENTVRVSLHRMRREFKELLLGEVKRTLDEGQDPVEEIQMLLRHYDS